ncbi:hypothetical protein GCM10028807_30810 [Spirosoma daeguense]
MTTNEVIVTIIASTVLFLLLVSAIFLIIGLYQRRRIRFIQETAQIKIAYQRELLQAQIETQNQTLEYIGRELHDNVGQMLSVAMLHINWLDEELTNSPHQELTVKTLQVIEQTIQEVRQLTKALDTDTVRRFGLRDSLTNELERIGHAKRFQTNLHVLGEPYDLGDETEIILFRMAQEALNNAIKHARAKTLTVTTDYRPEAFMLLIHDDGRGFDLNEATTRQVKTSGSGVKNLYQRTKLLGGTCVIDTKPGSGTRIEVTLLPKKNIDKIPH